MVREVLPARHIGPWCITVRRHATGFQIFATRNGVLVPVWFRGLVSKRHLAERMVESLSLEGLERWFFSEIDHTRARLSVLERALLCEVTASAEGARVV